MTKKEALKLFEDRKVRAVWDDEQEKWYFAIVDVVSIFTDNEYQTARKYWNKLKQRLVEEGNETVTNCHQLKLRAADGKMRLTDVADTEQLFRIIQSIPSPKAEPFKQWMAVTASERIDQIQDPELSIEQAMRDYKRLGYSDNWINQRLKKHRGTQRTYRRMATLWCWKAAIRIADRHYNKRMERTYDKRLQTPERAEERKSA